MPERKALIEIPGDRKRNVYPFRAYSQRSYVIERASSSAPKDASSVVIYPLHTNHERQRKPQMLQRRRASDSQINYFRRDSDFVRGLIGIGGPAAPERPVACWGGQTTEFDREGRRPSDAMLEYYSQICERKKSDASEATVVLRGASDSLSVTAGANLASSEALTTKQKDKGVEVGLPSNMQLECRHGVALGQGLCWLCWKDIEGNVLANVNSADSPGDPQDILSDDESLCDSVVEYEQFEAASAGTGANSMLLQGIDSFATVSTAVVRGPSEDFQISASRSLHTPAANTIRVDRGFSSLPARLRPVSRKSVTFSDEIELGETWHPDDYERGYSLAEQRVMRQRMMERAWRIQKGGGEEDEDSDEWKEEEWDASDSDLDYCPAESDETRWPGTAGPVVSIQHSKTFPLPNLKDFW